MKPMLACTPKRENIPFPVYASPKIDGIRALVVEGQLVSRTLKPLPNRFVQNTLDNRDWNGLNGLDGEITVGPPNSLNVMQKTTSGIMSADGEPQWNFWIFDLWCIDETYDKRMAFLKDTIRMAKDEWRPDALKNFHFLNSSLLHNLEELAAYESEMINQGYEGVMLRKPDSYYKFGRSTEREFALAKIKKFSDSEATIIGFAPLLKNNNDATVDNLGYTVRSTHRNRKEIIETLGSIRVVNAAGIEFDIGTGFSAQQRKDIWDMKEELIGKTIRYKHFEKGIVDAPRFPVFSGFRED